MSLELIIDTREFRAGMRRLDGFPFPGLMDSLADQMVGEVVKTLVTRKSNQVTGEAFKAWSASYRQSGAPFHGGHEMLVLSGDMLASVKKGAVTNDSAEVSASGPARFHVFGTDKMAARDFMSVGETQEDRLLQTVANAIDEELRSAA